MTLLGFVLRSRGGTMLRIMSGNVRILFDGASYTYERSDALDHLAGEWSALAHREVLGLTIGYLFQERPRLVGE